MPKDSWTPEELAIISQLVQQTNIGGNLPGEDVGISFSVNLTSPGYGPQLPQPPIFNPTLVAYSNAPTMDQALDDAQKQIDDSLSQSEAAITEWLASVGDYRRYFRLYREAIARAKERYKREPSRT